MMQPSEQTNERRRLVEGVVCLILFGRPARPLPKEHRDAADARPGLAAVLDLFG